MALDIAKPTDDGLLINAPGQIRANWEAIVLGTNSSLLITNAKCSPSMGLVDSKLSQITSSEKVSGSAITSINLLPAGAGTIPLSNIPSTLTGKDADTLDGEEGSYYRDVDNINAGDLAVANGGLGADFSTGDQGSVLYFSATGVITVLPPGTDGQILKSQGAAANPVWGETGSYTAITSGLVEVNGSTERVIAPPQNTYTKIKQLTPLPRDGVVDLSVTTKMGGGWDYKVRFYKNGSPIGTEIDCAGDTYDEKTLGDVSVSKGDIFAVWMKETQTGGEDLYAKEFKVIVDQPTVISEDDP